MHWISMMCLGIVLLAFIMAIVRTSTHSLYGSGVGSRVVHQDVHDAVREQWQMRIQHEMNRRDAERRRA